MWRAPTRERTARAVCAPAQAFSWPPPMHPLCHTLPAGDAHARAAAVKTWHATLCAISHEAWIARGKIAACCRCETDRASGPARNVQRDIHGKKRKRRGGDPPRRRVFRDLPATVLSAARGTCASDAADNSPECVQDVDRDDCAYSDGSVSGAAGVIGTPGLVCPSGRWAPGNSCTRIWPLALTR